MPLDFFLKLNPEYRDYIWGGDRLRPGKAPTAEAWVIYEGDRIAEGELAGKTLAEVCVQFGDSFLGQRSISRTGKRFPLLIKLLDCAQWLSLQVHPNDEQAVELEGPGQFGKTEAWHVLEAAPGAKLIAGLKPNISSDVLADSIRNGTVTEYCQYTDVSVGDTIFMPAGTLHALGPGFLIYEVQQTSDWTYRVYDWGRPETEMRRLHIDKSIRVARADFTAPIIPAPGRGDGSQHTLVRCEYFTLELLSTVSKPIELDTNNETFHALTVIEGKVMLQSVAESMQLEKFETVLVPASFGSYKIEPVAGECQILKSSV